MWSYLGLVISLFAFVYAVVFLLKTLLFGTDVPGFPTLVISVMFFAGVQLLSLGIIGEYLGRMYQEVKGRPLFSYPRSWVSSARRRARIVRPGGRARVMALSHT